jgi:hypothetical protein
MGAQKIDREVWDGYNPDKSMLDNIKEFIQFHDDNTNAGQGRKDDSKNVYDYYKGVRQSELLKDELKKRFPRTWSNRRLATENITAAITNKIGVVYKSAPVRSVSIPQTESTDELLEEDLLTEKEEEKELQNLYDTMIKQVQHDKNMQKLERFQYFDRTNLVQIGWLEKANRMTEWVIPQFLFDVMTDDEGTVIAIIKSSYFGDAIKEQQLRTYEVWTKDNLWYLDNELKLSSKNSENEYKNPYEDLPFYFARAEEPDQGVYCEANLMLKNVNQNVNLLLTDLMYQSEMQSHGQPVAINCEFPEDVNFGSEYILDIEAKNPEAGAPSFEFLSSNADFDGIFNTLSRVLTGYTTSIGLPSGMFSFEKSGGAESGVSLKIQNAPMIEFRQSMEQTFLTHEEEILEKQIMVWNHNSNNHGLGTLPEDLVINITYTDPQEAFETPKDRVATMLLLQASDLMKPTEIVMENHPSFTVDDAKKYLLEVKKEKKELLGTSSVEPAVGANIPPEERATSTFNQVINNSDNAESEDAVQPDES